jgi:hypothetical protein
MWFGIALLLLGGFGYLTANSHAGAGDRGFMRLIRKVGLAMDGEYYVKRQKLIGIAMALIGLVTIAVEMR